jgi:Cu/Ag efflux protein CusF
VRFRSALLLICAIVSFTACKKTPPPREYTMQGVVMALNAQDHTATIKHGKIGDWMEAMTMEYPIKDQADWKKLAVGDRIEATVFVSGLTYYVGNVRVTGAATPAAR